MLTPLIALVGADLTAPLFPEATKLVTDMSADEIWSRYVRYIGAGAVAAAASSPSCARLPTMAGSFMAVARGFRERSEARGGRPVMSPDTDRDVPSSFVVGGDRRWW